MSYMQRVNKNHLSRMAYIGGVIIAAALSSMALHGCASPPYGIDPLDETVSVAASDASDATMMVEPDTLTGHVEKVVVVPEENKPYPKQEMVYVADSLWPAQPQRFAAPDTNPDVMQQTEWPIWSTFYRVHVTKVQDEGVALRNLNGESLVDNLSAKDWCYAALEGTVYVENYGVYNYAGRGKTKETDCSPWLGKFNDRLLRAMQTTRFSKVAAPFGTGGKGWWLVPFRSIAVDRKVVPLGTVVYIPSARGQQVVLPDGRAWQHDGYFLAADTGGAIKTNHIDLFTGFFPDNPFPELEVSNRKQFVEAYIVDAPAIQKALIQQHKSRR